MREHAHDNLPPPDASAGHERSDADIGPLLWAGATLVGVAVVVHVVLIGVMWIFERDERRTDPSVSPVAAVQVPTAPMLQPTIEFHPTLPAQDMKALRARNAELLASYDWVDREKGIVRIPINAAMEKLLRQSQGATTREARR